MENKAEANESVRLLGPDTGHALGKGEIGAVIARAGVGKTAVLVQLALENLLNGKNVLHVGLDQTVRKVCLWYEEVFNHVTAQGRTSPGAAAWDSILPHRFVMVFPQNGFSVSQLEHRVGELSEQGIFHPQAIVIDGMDLDNDGRRDLEAIKSMAAANNLFVWLTVRAHREDMSPDNPLPESFGQVSDLFSKVLKLEPAGQQIFVKTLLPDQDEARDGTLVLDPTSLLLAECRDEKQAAGF
ncbi:MAG: cytoplasmic protein [Desulfatibacillaceae bacterium]